MKNLKFKQLPYQTEAVVDCFAGQPKLSALSYRIDPGREARKGETIKQQHEAKENPLNANFDKKEFQQLQMINRSKN